MRYLLTLIMVIGFSRAQDSTQQLRLPNSSMRFNLMEYINPPQNFGDAHVCLWEDDKEAAFTYTIDGVWKSDHKYWMEAMDRFGLRTTFFVISHTVGTGNWSPWDSVAALYNKGYCIQSHSAYHNPTDRHESGELNLWIEYRGSKDSIESAMPYNPCYTIAYPGGGWPNDVDSAILAGYNGGRGTTAKPNQAYSINYMNLQSSSGWDTSRVTTLLDPTVLIWGRNYRYGWSSFHMHSAETDAKKAANDSHLQLLKDYEDRLWIGGYSDVTLYGQERDSHTLTVTSVDDNLITFNLTDAMHDTVFTYPLTVKVKVDSSWDTVVASQDGNPVDAALKTDSTGIYALVKAVPDQGEVTVSNGQTSYIMNGPAAVVPAETANGVLLDLQGRPVSDVRAGFYLRYDAAANRLQKVMILK